MLGCNNTISTTQLASDNDSHRNYDTTGLTDVKCYIERMGLQDAAYLGEGNPYMMYELAADTLLDLNENDEVTDKDSYVYRVLSVQKVDDIVKFTKAVLARKI